MSYDRFTERSRRVMQMAHQEAMRNNHEYVGTEHLLVGLIREGGGATNALTKLGAGLRRTRDEISKLVSAGPDVAMMGRLPQTPRVKKVIETAAEEAEALGHNFIEPEHLLLGLLHDSDGVAAQALMNIGINLDDIRNEVLEQFGQDGAAGFASVGEGADGRVHSNSADSDRNQSYEARARSGKSKTPALDSFGRDLTQLAREKKLDPVIGREKEIERTMQILCRRSKNNPALLGEAGVGKTAIAEGFAQRIADGNVPEILLNRRVVALDLAMMVAGTKYRGQFEERIKALMNEVKRVKNIILFIDEMHTIVGAGGAEGALDAANVLKPALARGELQCIGATTYDEYRKYIEKDNALERRFQVVPVAPPSVDETVEILRGLRDRYEKHHRVTIKDDAIKAAVELSDRYISGRCLPDKAIDVLDEAGSRVRIQTMMRPPNLKEMDRATDEMNKRKDDAVKRQQFEEAARLRDEIGKVQKKKTELQKNWRDLQNRAVGEVNATVISEVISNMTGVPLTRLSVEDSKRLIKMEEELHKRVVSQDEAIQAIAKAIRRSRSGIQDPKRPIGSFIFAGPTGVGKTLLAKALAEFMFGAEEALVQVDMSEYMEKHNVSRLIGAPPGYVGHDEGGQLTEKIRRRPYSVVLLDEIEKAHPDVFNLMLQVLEEGRLTDSYGRIIDFRNTIVVMTTNVGAEAIKNESAFGFQRPDGDTAYEGMKQRVNDEIERAFRPEFINRFNDVIIFRHLTENDLVGVVDLELKKLRERLVSKNLCLLVTDEAKKTLIKRGSNLDFGARPLRRAIESSLEDPLAENLLSGFFDAADVISVEVEEVADEAEKTDKTKNQLRFKAKKYDELTQEEANNPSVVEYRAKIASKEDLEAAQARLEAERDVEPEPNEGEDEPLSLDKDDATNDDDR